MYAICFGANVPPSFAKAPSSSEVDRSLVIYLPNRFCDEVGLRRKPASPRRFKKLNIEAEVARPEITWAILVIPVRVRRGTLI